MLSCCSARPVAAGAAACLACEAAAHAARPSQKIPHTAALCCILSSCGVQGKRHQQNLAKRAAREAQEKAAAPAPQRRVQIKKTGGRRCVCWSRGNNAAAQQGCIILHVNLVTGMSLAQHSAAATVCDTPAQPMRVCAVCCCCCWCCVAAAVKIGRPGYRVTKQFDQETRQRSLLFQVSQTAGPYRC